MTDAQAADASDATQFSITPARVFADNAARAAFGATCAARIKAAAETAQ